MAEPIRFSDVPEANPFPGVLSKLVMNQEKGAAAVTVGELRIAAGKTVPLHVHKVIEALVFISGEAAVEVDGKVTQVKPLSVLLAPAGTRHTIRNAGTEELRIIFFFPAVEVARILVEQ
ncbi:MAG: cupin domain-containing protein [Desulfobaccales bacterium]